MAKKGIQTADLQEAIELYLPYILEIRKRILFVTAIFLVFLILGFIYYDKIVLVLLNIFALEGVNIVFTSPFQFVTLAMTIGFMMGALFMFPMIVFQLIAFIKPALAPKEYKIILYLIPLSFALFLSGFVFGVLMMRYVVVLFYERTTQLDIGNFLDISQLLSQILTTAVFMGIAFQLPIFLTIALRFGIIKHEFLAKKRIYAYSLSAVFAAFLPPTDLLSLVLLTIPIIGLYEITLFVNRVFLKPKNKE
jgi:sec-independent protein translocase protein TatC